MVKVFENLPLGDFGNVVHRLASIVPNSCILVGEASQHGWDYDFEVTRKFLQENVSPLMSPLTDGHHASKGVKYRAQGDGSSSQAYETSIASMRLVDSVGILVT